MDADERDGCDGASEPQPPRTPALEPLERRVLELAATGLGTTELADHLGMSVETVRGILRAVIDKLGARSKLEALIIAIRHRIIDLPPS